MKRGISVVLCAVLLWTSCLGVSAVSEETTIAEKAEENAEIALQEMEEGDWAYEAEPNDSMESAQNFEIKDSKTISVLMGTAMNASGHADSDWYRFSVEVGGTASIALGYEKEPPSFLLVPPYGIPSWQLSLYRSDGSLAGVWEETCEVGTVSTDLITLSPGTYYICVNYLGISQQIYALAAGFRGEAVSSADIYIPEQGGNPVKAALIANQHAPEGLEYRWLVYSYTNKSWSLVSDWSSSNWVTWKPEWAGQYMLQGEIRDPSGNVVKACRDYTHYMNFRDVPGDAWYYDPVAFVYYKGIMTGMDSQYFGAAEPIARAQFATILYRMAGGYNSSYMPYFPDVPRGAWYTPAVIWACEGKIINGYASGWFGPSDNITREQMAVMMYRYAAYRGYPTEETADLDSYTDGSDVSEFAVEAMKWAVGAGIISGKAGERLSPGESAARAETAVIIMRFLNKYGK